MIDYTQNQQTVEILNAPSDKLEQQLAGTAVGSAAHLGITTEMQRRMMSGDAMLAALESAVNDLVRRAPQDHDIIIMMRDISVTKVSFIKPYAFLFEGFDQGGHGTAIVLHFTQIDARVVYVPKRGPDRVITGFAA